MAQAQSILEHSRCTPALAPATCQGAPPVECTNLHPCQLQPSYHNALYTKSQLPPQLCTHFSISHPARVPSVQGIQGAWKLPLTSALTVQPRCPLCRESQDCPQTMFTLAPAVSVPDPPAHPATAWVSQWNSPGTPSLHREWLHTQGHFFKFRKSICFA